MATTIPATLSRITQATLIRETIDRELAAIVRATENGDNPIRRLLQSWDAIAATSCDQLSPLLLTLTSDEADLGSKIGWMIRHGLPAPFGITVSAEGAGEGAETQITLEPGATLNGLHEPAFWIDREFAAHRRHYRTTVRRYATQVGLPQLEEGFHAERSAAILWDSSVAESDGLTIAELEEICPFFDWRLFMREAVSEGNVKLKGVSRRFLERLSRMLSQPQKQKQWHSWLGLLAVQWFAGLSPPGPLRLIWFDHNRRFFLGIPRDRTASELRGGPGIVATLLPHQLGKLWVDRHKAAAERIKSGVMSILADVKEAAVRCIARTSWMDARAKAAATEKIRRMRIDVGFPSSSAKAETLLLSPEDYIGNLLAIGAHNATRRNDPWTYPVFTVNAFYFTDENRLLLPLGMMRPPFYDPDASRATNLGGIGTTIGHELCHALDSEGQHYDATGVRRELFTGSATRTRFRQLEERVVRLFASETVDGRLTLPENMADLGGLEFALEALVSSDGGGAAARDIKEFFIAYSVSWRAKERLRRQQQLAAMDPHAPPPLRVNKIVQQFPEWFDVFSCSNTKRATRKHGRSRSRIRSNGFVRLFV